MSSIRATAGPASCRATNPFLARAAWLWLGLALLAGCGPGVVGTGSGPGDAIQFQPMNVCDAPFRDSGLDCNPTSHEPDTGTQPVTWADVDRTGQGATVSMALEAHELSLTLPCRELTFEGRWGELPDGRQAFVGRYVDAKHPDGLPAVLLAKADPTLPDAAAVVELLDDQGDNLNGPWIVQRVPPPVSFAACAP